MHGKKRSGKKKLILMFNSFELPLCNCSVLKVEEVCRNVNAYKAVGRYLVKYIKLKVLKLNIEFRLLS